VCISGDTLAVCQFERSDAGVFVYFLLQSNQECLISSACSRFRILREEILSLTVVKRNLQKEKIASTSDLEQAVAESGKTQADVKSVEATDAIARLNLERSRVRAPFDGAVAQRLASVGDYVAIGTPIVRIVQTDPLRLRLEVPERESVVVRPGQNVRLTVDGDTNTYPGRLVRIAPAIHRRLAAGKSLNSYCVKTLVKA
jgi:multidrug resistance efflux pump